MEHSLVSAVHLFLSHKIYVLYPLQGKVSPVQSERQREKEGVNDFSQCAHLWKEKSTNICNQACVFAISHSAPESILPAVMQHQQ